MRFPRSSSSLLILLGVAGFSCSGRTHSQQQGTYAITLNSIIRDECTLSTILGVRWLGAFYFSGDIAWLQMDDLLYGTQLVGSYLNGIEEFKLDGTVANVNGSTNKDGSGPVDCLLDNVATNFNARTDHPGQFHGTVRVKYESTNPRCICELWAEYQAVH
jgi:hypothetical protein